MNIRIVMVMGAALLLPSCVSWNTGERIREAKVTYTGLDLSRPVEGRLYECRSDVGFHYFQAPEVTYHERTPLVQVPLFGIGDEVQAVDVKDTGKVFWVRRAAPSKNAAKTRPGKMLETPPQDLILSREVKKPEPASTAKEMAVSAVSNDADYESARLLSVPLRYVVDPVLSLASTAVMIPTVAVGGTAYGLWTIFSTPVRKAVRAVLPTAADADGVPMPEAPVVMP